MFAARNGEDRTGTGVQHSIAGGAEERTPPSVPEMSADDDQIGVAPARGFEDGRNRLSHGQLDLVRLIGHDRCNLAAHFVAQSFVVARICRNEKTSGRSDLERIEARLAVNHRQRRREAIGKKPRVLQRRNAGVSQVRGGEDLADRESAHLFLLYTPSTEDLVHRPLASGVVTGRCSQGMQNPLTARVTQCGCEPVMGVNPPLAAPVAAPRARPPADSSGRSRRRFRGRPFR